MKWFKHDTDATQDAKLRKLIIRYKAVGYAVYFHCLELIAGDISESNISFELEHDAEIIADNLKIDGTGQQSGAEIVSEIMRYILELRLFEGDNDKIFCFKLLKRLDSSMTSNKKMRDMIMSAKKSHDTVMISHDAVMQEENRLDKRRTEEREQNPLIKIMIDSFGLISDAAQLQKLHKWNSGGKTTDDLLDALARTAEAKTRGTRWNWIVDLMDGKEKKDKFDGYDLDEIDRICKEAKEGKG